jgi:hypothetical protein
MSVRKRAKLDLLRRVQVDKMRDSFRGLDKKIYDTNGTRPDYNTPEYVTLHEMWEREQSRSRATKYYERDWHTALRTQRWDVEK